MSTPARTKLGDRGDAVRAWQAFLAERGLLTGKVDGVHGKGTEAASVAWEQGQKPRAKRTELTDEQRRAIDGVLSIFETGKPSTPASYATCTVLADGAGISYGKHQCTDKAGTLDLVCRRYIELGGTFAGELGLYMPRLATNESAKVDPKGVKPDWLLALMGLLRQAGADPIMQRAQDEVFAEQYMAPALDHAERYGIASALGVLVLYDTTIHSGPARVPKHAAKVLEAAPGAGGDERAWLAQYITVRRAWLAASDNALVRTCVYRPDELGKLLAEGNLGLRLPLKVRGQVVS